MTSMSAFSPIRCSLCNRKCLSGKESCFLCYHANTPCRNGETCQNKNCRFRHEYGNKECYQGQQCMTCHTWFAPRDPKFQRCHKCHTSNPERFQKPCRYNKMPGGCRKTYCSFLHEEPSVESMKEANPLSLPIPLIEYGDPKVHVCYCFSAIDMMHPEHNFCSYECYSKQ